MHNNTNWNIVWNVDIVYHVNSTNVAEADYSVLTISLHLKTAALYVFAFKAESEMSCHPASQTSRCDPHKVFLCISPVSAMFGLVTGIEITITSNTCFNNWWSWAKTAFKICKLLISDVAALVHHNVTWHLLKWKSIECALQCWRVFTV